jgi:hypothetical protein
MMKAREWILAHPDASIEKTSRACEISLAAVSKLRKELHEANVLPPYPHSRQPAKEAEVDAAQGITTDALLRPVHNGSNNRRSVVPEGMGPDIEALLDGTANVDREYRVARLKQLIQVGGPDHIIRASQALEDMERRDGAKEEIGPLPPQTLQEAVADVADVVEALATWGGEPAVKEAVMLGMKRFNEAQKEAVAEHKEALPS